MVGAPPVHLQPQGFKMFKMLNMLTARRGPQHLKPFKHFETRGLKMFEMCKMLAVRRRPQHFKPFEHA